MERGQPMRDPLVSKAATEARREVDDAYEVLTDCIAILGEGETETVASRLSGAKGNLNDATRWLIAIAGADKEF